MKSKSSARLRQQVHQDMVFDGFRWYPKDSHEGKVTQESMAERQPIYGPIGAKVGSGIVQAGGGTDQARETHVQVVESVTDLKQSGGW